MCTDLLVEILIKTLTDLSICLISLIKMPYTFWAIKYVLTPYYPLTGEAWYCCKTFLCVKSVQIRSYFWSVFSCIQSEYRKIRTRNNSAFRHFSCKVSCTLDTNQNNIRHVNINGILQKLKTNAKMKRRR